MRIAIAKEAFNRKMSLLTRKLNIELKKKIGTEVFGELRNVVQEENGEDKMFRQSN